MMPAIMPRRQVRIMPRMSLMVCCLGLLVDGKGDLAGVDQGG